MLQLINKKYGESRNKSWTQLHKHVQTSHPVPVSPLNYMLIVNRKFNRQFIAFSVWNKSHNQSERYRPQIQNKPELVYRNKSSATFLSVPCINYGYKHSSDSCPAIGQSYNFCSVSGHFVKVFRKRLSKQIRVQWSKSCPHRGSSDWLAWRSEYLLSRNTAVT